MAEFVQTMKDWKRMCSAMEKLRPDDSCNGCRLEGYGCPAIYEDDSHVDYADVEKNVTAWAAEHPEPVYPTWREWLIKNGLIDFKPDFKSLSYNPYLSSQENLVIECLNAKASEPIPADIAERLGIEPKETNHGT